jgi:serine/threonine protein phosphatase PrpC
VLHFDTVDVDVRGRTHVGRVRKVNQDHFLVSALHKVIDIHDTSLPPSYHTRFHSGARALLLLVADGVGGGPGGERASSLTLDAIMQYVTNSMRCFYKLDQMVSSDLLRELASSVHESHIAVRAEADIDPESEGMATTLTLAHVLWPRAYLAHIGDSRCYHFRNSVLTQVTQDQTVSQALLDAGTLSEEEAARSPYGHLLTQAVGASNELEPAVLQVELDIGDTMLLCTDGLSKHVPAETIARVLGTSGDAEATSAALVDAALDAGGSDNVTALVARFHTPQKP